MRKFNTNLQKNPVQTSPNFDPITEIVRIGAQKILEQALHQEIEEYLKRYENYRDHNNHQLVVRNGYLPQRAILTGVGAIPITQPRARDKRNIIEKVKFESKILPPYLRKTKNIEEFLPWLYLKGISTGDMEETLRALLGENAKGLSSSVISRLKEAWKKEYENWQRRSLQEKQYVYIFCDGIYTEPRGDEKRLCLLVMIGVTIDGVKEIIAIQDGYRESEQSWRELLLDLKNRGLTLSPKLVTGDGGLGLWAAFEKIFGETKTQRCWVHKTANILDKMPKSVQAKAKNMLHEVYLSPTKELATKTAKHFIKTFDAKYPKATDCLSKDLDKLLTFYDFPAEHWSHIRTTNPIESAFATVRHRTYKMKGCGSRETYLTMTFKLLQQAEKRWRRINAPELASEVAAGIIFRDGIRVEEELPQITPAKKNSIEEKNPRFAKSNA
jgi:transposase-like protein